MKKNNKSRLKTISFEELEEKHYGKIGTKSRNEYEARIQQALIGEMIKQMREKKNLTQTQLAKKVGMDKSYISRIENNIKTLRLDTVFKVLKVLKAGLFIRIPNAKGWKEIELI